MELGNRTKSGNSYILYRVVLWDPARKLMEDFSCMLMQSLQLGELKNSMDQPFSLACVASILEQVFTRIRAMVIHSRDLGSSTPEAEFHLRK